MTRHMALFYVKGLILNFIFLYNLHLWVFFFFCDCTQQDNFFSQLIIVEKVATYQKKLDVIHILFCLAQQ